MSLKEELAEWVLKAHIPGNLGATWTKRLSNGEHYCIWAMSYAKEHGDTALAMRHATIEECASRVEELFGRDNHVADAIRALKEIK